MTLYVRGSPGKLPGPVASQDSLKSPDLAGKKRSLRERLGLLESPRLPAIN